MSRAHILAAAIASTVIAVFWFIVLIAVASSTNLYGQSDVNAGGILLTLVGIGASGYAAFVLFRLFAAGVTASVTRSAPPAGDTWPDGTPKR
jgi:hypothetical protein